MMPCGHSRAMWSRPRASTGCASPCSSVSPWGGRECALPVLTVPTRSPALSQKLGKPHRTIPHYAQTLVRLVRRWYPKRDLLLVGDRAFAAARLGHTCREQGVRLISRLLLNAQLYDPVSPQPKGKPGVKPKKGPRQPKLSDRLTDEATVWQTEEAPWYAGQSLTMDLTSGAALWRRALASRWSSAAPHSLPCCCAIPQANGDHMPSFAPTLRPRSTKSSPGISVGGRSK
jgi:hypothetical protein